MEEKKSGCLVVQEIIGWIVLAVVLLFGSTIVMFAMSTN